MAMASLCSVTVSIAAETSGMFREIDLVSLVATLVSAGNTAERDGSRSTSSNVRASRIFMRAPSAYSVARHYILGLRRMTAPKWGKNRFPGVVRGLHPRRPLGLSSHHVRESLWQAHSSRRIPAGSPPASRGEQWQNSPAVFQERFAPRRRGNTVSYTHLTLPTSPKV